MQQQLWLRKTPPAGRQHIQVSEYRVGKVSVGSLLLGFIWREERGELEGEQASRWLQGVPTGPVCSRRSWAIIWSPTSTQVPAFHFPPMTTVSTSAGIAVSSRLGACSGHCNSSWRWTISHSTCKFSKAAVCHSCCVSTTNKQFSLVKADHSGGGSRVRRSAQGRTTRSQGGDVRNKREDLKRLKAYF